MVKAMQIKKLTTNQSSDSFRLDLSRLTYEFFQSHAVNKKHKRKVGQTLTLALVEP